MPALSLTRPLRVCHRPPPAPTAVVLLAAPLHPWPSLLTCVPLPGCPSLSSLSHLPPHGSQRDLSQASDADNSCHPCRGSQGRARPAPAAVSAPRTVPGADSAVTTHSPRGSGRQDCTPSSPRPLLFLPRRGPISREVAQEHHSLFKGLVNCPWPSSSAEPPVLAGRGTAGCVTAAVGWLAVKRCWEPTFQVFRFPEILRLDTCQDPLFTLSP